MVPLFPLLGLILIGWAVALALRLRSLDRRLQPYRVPGTVGGSSGRLLGRWPEEAFSGEGLALARQARRTLRRAVILLTLGVILILLD
jgi:hypothetical protein